MKYFIFLWFVIISTKISCQEIEFLWTIDNNLPFENEYKFKSELKIKKFKSEVFIEFKDLPNKIHKKKKVESNKIDSLFSFLNNYEFELKPKFKLEPGERQYLETIFKGDSVIVDGKAYLKSRAEDLVPFFYDEKKQSFFMDGPIGRIDVTDYPSKFSGYYKTDKEKLEYQFFKVSMNENDQQLNELIIRIIKESINETENIKYLN